MKPGYLTTEFMLTVLAVICATVLVATGDLDAGTWTTLVTGSTAAYTLSRGVAKINPPKNTRTKVD